MAVAAYSARVSSAHCLRVAEDAEAAPAAGLFEKKKKKKKKVREGGEEAAPGESDVPALVSEDADDDGGALSGLQQLKLPLQGWPPWAPG